MAPAQSRTVFLAFGLAFGAALGGALYLWHDRGTAMLLDLAVGLTGFLCL